MKKALALSLALAGRRLGLGLPDAPADERAGRRRARRGRRRAGRLGGFGRQRGRGARGRARIGAGTGALIGSAATPQPTGQCARWGYDYNGNRVCVAYY